VPVRRRIKAGRMYICLCNSFTDRDVHGAIAGGSRSVASVYKKLSCTPQCGKCVPEVRSMLQSGSHAVPCGAFAKPEE